MIDDEERQGLSVKLWKRTIVANTIEELEGFVYELFDEQVLNPWSIEPTTMMRWHACSNKVW